MNSTVTKKKTLLIPFIILYITLTVLMRPYEFNIHYALMWNLFLSFIPWVLAMIIIRPNIKFKKILTFLWVVMLPNAFYMFTDFIHITLFSFYIPSPENVNLPYSSNILNWIAVMHIVLTILIGIFMGLRSMKLMLDYKYPSKNATYFSLVALLSLLNGIGIYMGRFLRLNSWDILHPAKIVSEISASLTSFALQYIGIFAILVFAIYLVFEYYYREH